VAGQHKAVSRAGRARPANKARRGLAPDQVDLKTREIVGPQLEALHADVPATCLSRVGKMIELIAAWSALTNLTSEPTDPVELAFHVMDSLMPLIIARRDGPAALAAAFGAGKRMLDLGSGAGFPGLVLAAAIDAEVTLTDARRRRASFLATTAEEMGLFGVIIRPVQVTEKGLDGSYDLVTARALDSGSDFHQLAHAALKRGGLAMQYASAGQAASAAKSTVDGFELIATIPYELSRGPEQVRRAALVWRRR